MSQVLVNADDFGLTSGVNRAIAELHKAGLVTSTTLMARAGATDEAIATARATPSLGVGCHVVLVDGEPVLPPQQIPSLIDAKTGQFLPTLTQFLLRLLAGRMPAAEIEAEAGAQIGLLKARGLRLTHVDTHKHTHMFPAVLRPVLRAARAAGVTAVRNPFEPVWAIRATPRAPWMRQAEESALRWFEPAIRRLIAQEGFVTTDGTIGVLATGTLDAASLSSLLQSLLLRVPEGTWELVTHPGYNDAGLNKVRTRLRASRELEMAALRVIEGFPQIELVSFAALRAPSAPATNL